MRDDAALAAWFARNSTSTSPGPAPTFDLPLRLHGTDFQVEVWEQLRRIPYGETISYGELAQRVDRPEAARAVGVGERAEPDRDRRAVPSRDRCRRLAHRLRRRPRLEALAPRSRAAAGLAPRRVTDVRRRAGGRRDGARRRRAAARAVRARLLRAQRCRRRRRRRVRVPATSTRTGPSADRHPFLFRVDGRLAGFALVRSGRAARHGRVLRAAEVPAGGVGTDAARAVFARFPGQWQIRQQCENTGAIDFWRRAIPVPFDETPRRARAPSSAS